MWRSRPAPGCSLLTETDNHAEICSLRQKLHHLQQSDDTSPLRVTERPSSRSVQVETTVSGLSDQEHT